MSVIIVSGGENFFLHLLGKAEAAATVFGVDVIDKPIVVEHEFLMNLASAAQAFICVLPSGIFSITLLDSGGEIRVHFDHSSVVSADLVREVETFLYIFEYVLVRGSCELSFSVSEARQSVGHDI